MPQPFPNLPPYLRGRVVCLDHASRVLADNPWGDPAHRDLHVLLPPGYDVDDRRYPAVLLLPGYAGTGEGMLSRGLTDISIASRIDRLIHGIPPDAPAVGPGAFDDAGRIDPTRGCPPFIAVLPDCMTRLGGSQFVDSPAMGAYATWLVDEIMPFVDGRFRTTGRWGVAGRSSGGFGALHLAMTRPGRFSAVVSHAGDMGFDLIWLGDLPRAVAGVQAAGGLGPFMDNCWRPQRWSPEHFSALMIIAMSCCFSPDMDADGPVPARLPVDFETGAVDFEVFELWKRFDPLERVHDPAAQDALRQLDLLFIDAGDRDEYLLHLGARRLSAALSDADIPHIHEEFPGGHRGTAWRWDRSLPLLAEALSRQA
ncbi:MAG: esterase [Deltaproteobacteria bacterium]|nr:MAG: esterase [Deltaproteobacteria bacterium]